MNCQILVINPFAALFIAHCKRMVGVNGVEVTGEYLDYTAVSLYCNAQQRSFLRGYATACTEIVTARAAKDKA